MWRQINIIYMWYLGLAVKRLRFINCLNASTNNCATLRNQSLCRGTVILHKNDETNNSSGLHFKA